MKCHLPCAGHHDADLLHEWCSHLLSQGELASCGCGGSPDHSRPESTAGPSKANTERNNRRTRTRAHALDPAIPRAHAGRQAAPRPRFHGPTPWNLKSRSLTYMHMHMCMHMSYMYGRPHATSRAQKATSHPFFGHATEIQCLCVCSRAGELQATLLRRLPGPAVPSLRAADLDSRCHSRSV